MISWHLYSFSCCNSVLQQKICSRRYGVLQSFVTWFSQAKKIPNITRLITSHVPAARGRKGGVPPRKRIKMITITQVFHLYSHVHTFLLVFSVCPCYCTLPCSILPLVNSCPICYQVQCLLSKLSLEKAEVVSMLWMIRQAKKDPGRS